MNKKVAMALVLGLGSVAVADSLKDTKQMESWNEDLKGAIDSTKATCGFAVAGTLDKGFLKSDFAEKNRTAGGYCGSIFEGIRYLCDDKTAKPLVEKKVKKVTCKLGKDKKPTFKLSGTELVVTFTSETSDMSSGAKKYLEENL